MTTPTTMAHYHHVGRDPPRLAPRVTAAYLWMSMVAVAVDHTLVALARELHVILPRVEGAIALLEA